MMWKIKKFTFTTASELQTARRKRDEWVKRNSGRYQMEAVFINNALAVQYRELRRIG